MIDKLREIIIHYESLETQMLDPDLMNDQTRYTEVAKEHRRLAPIVEKSKVYIATQEQIDDDNEILAGEDEELKDIAQAEIEELQADLGKQEEELKVLLIPHDPTDDKNTILEIRAGTGGDEAALFAADLFRMYSRFAERNGLKYEVMESNAIGIGGFKEIIFSVKGESVYGLLKFESGVHRVQRVPKTETSGRVHTSAATVAVLPEAEEADVEVVDADLKIDTYRASGAGGQHVNKTESAIRITHIPTGLVVTCQDETSQHKNKAAALKVLRSRLLAAEQEKLAKERAAARRDMVSTGDRSAKIRTYNFPQGRITDHRINFTAYNLEGVMDGDIADIIENLKLADQQAQLASVGE
ncbi:MAG: peptide chain release factor 1 [Candidatus Marinimicrobia bacterium]|jgi:peptide chain release factor 1|nr:peptide chain release factor 1 [Candidatus Neomarinimicrobiota bacterium]MDP6991125.1 peptide chain release factor 1 [Candidatus Neomarinimicrobiota bacterium]